MLDDDDDGWVVERARGPPIEMSPCACKSSNLIPKVRCSCSEVMVVPPGNEASVCRALADIEDDATLEGCSEDGLLVVCEEEECC